VLPPCKSWTPCCCCCCHCCDRCCWFLLALLTLPPCLLPSSPRPVPSPPLPPGRVNRFNSFEGWVGSESVGADILVSGRIDMNRAMEGDIVAGGWVQLALPVPLPPVLCGLHCTVLGALGGWHGGWLGLRALVRCSEVLIQQEGARAGQVCEQPDPALDSA
jgi:hypothetical protein